MAHLVHFPWIDREELKCVYDEVFSSDVNLKKHAVDRIQVWKCRVMGRLPSAIESTLALVSAELEHELKGATPDSDCYLRSLYSMALIRFVNHITERGQQGMHARPVHIVASEFGVPEWIVSLRHEATHGTLPSLNELRAAADWALKWLKEQFWDLQGTDTFGVSSLLSAAVEILEDSLVNLMQRRFQEIDSGNDAPNKQLYCNIEHMFQQLGTHACFVLLQDGYLIFTEEQLKCLGFNSYEIVNSSSLLLPRKLVQFWKKVLRILHRNDLLAELLLHMACSITDTVSCRNSLLCGWMYTLTWHNESRNLKKSVLFDQCVDLPYKNILEKCLHSSCAKLDMLVSILLDHVDLSTEQKKTLQEVFSLVKSLGLVSDCDIIYTTASCEKEYSTCIWSRCVDLCDWAKLPIGTLPEAPVTHTSLDLDRHVEVKNMEQDNMDFTASFVNETYSDAAELSAEPEICADINHDTHWDKSTMQRITEELQLF